MHSLLPIADVIPLHPSAIEESGVGASKLHAKVICACVEHNRAPILKHLPVCRVRMAKGKGLQVGVIAKVIQHRSSVTINLADGARRQADRQTET